MLGTSYWTGDGDTGEGEMDFLFEKAQILAVASRRIGKRAKGKLQVVCYSKEISQAPFRAVGLLGISIPSESASQAIVGH